jgi:hypothetical protein
MLGSNWVDIEKRVVLLSIHRRVEEPPEEDCKIVEQACTIVGEDCMTAVEDCMIAGEDCTIAEGDCTIEEKSDTEVRSTEERLDGIGEQQLENTETGERIEHLGRRRVDTEVVEIDIGAEEYIEGQERQLVRIAVGVDIAVVEQVGVCIEAEERVEAQVCIGAGVRGVQQVPHEVQDAKFECWCMAYRMRDLLDSLCMRIPFLRS